jgi:formylglycine-generating enzyme required for sulfatase activity
MAGNVSEWVWDGYESHEGALSALVDPTGKDNAAQRSVRGGSWGDGASLTRAAARAAMDSSTRASTLGFRLVRTRTP